MSDAVTGGRRTPRARSNAGAEGWAPWLDAGERLLWEGAPGDGIRFRRADRLLIPFSLVWCGFAVVWTAVAATQGAPWFVVLFGTVFVAIGLFMVVGRFFWDAHVRGLTRYALTDRRALIATRHAGRRLRSWPITAGTTLDVETGPTTSIFFASEETGSGRRRGRRRIGFEFIADGPEVLSLIRAVQRGEAGRAP